MHVHLQEFPQVRFCEGQLLVLHAFGLEPGHTQRRIGNISALLKVQVTYPDTATVFGNGAACTDDGRPALIQALEAAG
jgi:hypothetical protein